MRIAIVPLLAVLPVSPSGLSAQTKPPVEAGSRVRVTARDLGLYKQPATLEAWRGDTLILAAERTMKCPLASVTRLEVSRGPERSTGTGVLVGFLIGSGVGTSLVILKSNDSWFRLSAGEVAAVAALFGGIGAGIGALSTAFSPERWEAIPLGGLRVRPAAWLDGRVGLAASVRF
jgi:hypothetical protein